MIGTATPSGAVTGPGVRHRRVGRRLTKRRAVEALKWLPACMMRGEMWPRRPETIPALGAATAPMCPLRGCLVLVLGATAERNFFRSDLGLQPDPTSVPIIG
jgi:hypothetical protein